MDNEKHITLTRTLSAPREVVWQAWTDPEQLAKWWGPQGVTNPECRIDLRVGGEIYVVMLAGPELGPLAGQRWPMRGTFTEIVPPERLVFANNAVSEAGEVLIEGETTLILEDRQRHHQTHPHGEREGPRAAGTADACRHGGRVVAES